MSCYKSELKKLLYRMGVNGRYCGFDFVLACVDAMLRNPEARTCVKIAYLSACETCGAGRVNVERDIRTLITAIWNHGNRELLEEIAGHSLERRPKAKEFLLMLTDYMEQTCGLAVPEAGLEAAVTLLPSESNE